MFQFDDSWEEKDGREVLRALFNQPGLRRHPFVELAANPWLIHVDVVFDDEDQSLELWQRFIGTDLRAVVGFLQDNYFVKSKISLQSCHDPDKNYRIFDALTIFECLDENNVRYYLCDGSDGDTIHTNPQQATPKPNDRRVVLWKQGSLT